MSLPLLEELTLLNKHRQASLAGLAGLGLLATLLFAAPLTSQTTRGLDGVYQKQAAQLRSRLHLTDEQYALVGRLLDERKLQERHLRKQMRSTYTPLQRDRARKLWLERDGRTLPLAEAAALRARLGVSPEQEAQFQAYQRKLDAHREETLLLAAQLLDPSQRVALGEIAFDAH